MKPNVHTTIKSLLNEKLSKLEGYFNARANALKIQEQH